MCDVDQESYVVDCDAQFVETSGLLSCIGVAIVFDGRVSMSHYANAHITGFDDFCKEVEDLVPDIDRPTIRPIVAGGELGDEYRDEIKKSREHVVSELSKLGFGCAQIRWCPEGARSQTILVDTVNKTALIETDFKENDIRTETLQF
jgi:hypothetical protein